MVDKCDLSLSISALQVISLALFFLVSVTVISTSFSLPYSSTKVSNLCGSFEEVELLHRKHLAMILKSADILYVLIHTVFPMFAKELTIAIRQKTDVRIM